MDGQNSTSDDAKTRRQNGKILCVHVSEGQLSCFPYYASSPLLAPLLPTAAYMKQAHLDPTVIIAEPIPIDIVTSFTYNSVITLIIVCCVGSTLVGMTAAAGHRKSMSSLLWNLLQSLFVSMLGIIFLGAVVFLAAILCGASPWVDAMHTVFASGFVAALAFGPSLVFDAKQYFGSSPSHQIKRLFGGPQKNAEVTSSGSVIVSAHHHQSPSERIDCCTMYGTFVGLIPVSILRILDHGDQAQRWPFPILLGATIGYCAGSIVGILSSCAILLQGKGWRKASRLNASNFTHLTLISLSAVVVGIPRASAFQFNERTLYDTSTTPRPFRFALHMAPGEVTSTTCKYLEAISEFCDGDMPANDECGSAISSYLDALSVGVAESNEVAGRGIASYMDSFTAQLPIIASPPAPNTRAGSYLDAISEVCEPSKDMEPCVDAVSSYLDNLSPNDPSQPSHSLARPSSYLDSMTHSMPSIGGTKAASPSEFRRPSAPQDLALENWYKRHGIATGYVQVRTTDESVGGRGMFWSSPEAAKDAQILARIPKRCVLEASTAKLKWPEAMHWGHINDKNLEMLAAAMCAYTCTQADPAGIDWREWIDTWLGFGGVVPRPLKSYSSEEIQYLATTSGASFADVSVAIEVRYNAMKSDATKLEFPFTNGATGMTGDIFADMYSVVASRCAVMGPAWNYCYGIIPMHDMHNHPPPSVESSVELHALGDVRPHIEGLDDEVINLIHLSGVSDVSPPLDEQDILIVARRDIRPGEELFLAYRDPSETEGLTSNDRLWLLFQYGFPLVPVE